MPERIQRKRTKGWRMPKDAVYVGRPSRWGNPYIVNGEIVQHFDSRDFWCPDGAAPGEATEMFREDLAQGRMSITEGEVRERLHGLNLACWCPLDQPCHADVLLEIANFPAREKVELNIDADRVTAAISEPDAALAMRVESMLAEADQ